MADSTANQSNPGYNLKYTHTRIMVNYARTILYRIHYVFNGYNKIFRKLVLLITVVSGEFGTAEALSSSVLAVAGRESRVTSTFYIRE